MKCHSRIFLFLIILICLAFTERKANRVYAADTERVRQQCQSVTKSCGECISKHSDCAWCSDPNWNGTQRCEAKWVLASGRMCAPNFVFSPIKESKTAPQHNLPIGGKRADGVTTIQLEPQQVEVKMKPGDPVDVHFVYLHKPPLSGYEVRDFTIQTSEFRSLGLDVEFSVECNGVRTIGRVCPNVKQDQRINFSAKVSLRDCSNPNQMAVSIGIYGYNTVSAIYIQPICGCDCETPRNMERRSPRCNYQGNMVCGQCQCEKGRGGDQCECDLHSYGASSAADLLEQCKEHRTSAVCSGQGRCVCGKCQCFADYMKGRFCECDNTNCPLNTDGKMCSGRGACECGRCLCELGWSGDDCGCSDDQSPCTVNGVTCSNNGICECGRCACNVGWTGPTCLISQSLPVEMMAEETTSFPTTEFDEDEEEGDLLPEEPIEEQPTRPEDITPVKREQPSAAGPSPFDWSSRKSLLTAAGTLLAFFLGIAFL